MNNFFERTADEQLIAKAQKIFADLLATPYAAKAGFNTFDDRVVAMSSYPSVMLGGFLLCRIQEILNLFPYMELEEDDEVLSALRAIIR